MHYVPELNCQRTNLTNKIEPCYFFTLTKLKTKQNINGNQERNSPRSSLYSFPLERLLSGCKQINASLLLLSTRDVPWSFLLLTFSFQCYSLKTMYFYFMCMCVALSICLCTMCLEKPGEVRRECQTWTWKQLWATIQELEIKPMSFTKSGSAHNG